MFNRHQLYWRGRVCWPNLLARSIGLLLVCQAWSTSLSSSLSGSSATAASSLWWWWPNLVARSAGLARACWVGRCGSYVEDGEYDEDDVNNDDDGDDEDDDDDDPIWWPDQAGLAGACLVGRCGSNEANSRYYPPIGPHTSIQDTRRSL